ncbi:Tetratricopeptide TPR_1 repeat-containing protein [Halothece sp. PCC 7418]|uniref:tetratricopeptide repeat protein n=1 Tax=Halothece sp. (strain PCC 7418) TaxID=65093 RepID=UPI0002A05DFC|nr:tetratricopeptide repeat protein [Halothece sp. PCC 7418]AFZ42578.1 Tetratricopeptide TPR_1 repeat-containing protein [Halothece sp. PCC 7418]
MRLKHLGLGLGLILFSASPIIALEQKKTFYQESEFLIAHVNPEVMRILNETIEKNPDDPQPYLQRGLAFNHLEEYQKAIQDFNQVIKLDSDNVDAYNFRGTMHYRLGQYEQALADYNQAMKLDSDYALLYFNRGYVKVELGEIESAIADFETGANLSKQQGDLNTYQQAQALIEKVKVSPESIRPTEPNHTHN